jgi:hypothetical protein
MRRKINKERITAFLRAFFLTLVCIGCVGGIYLGCCKAYEAVRKNCFADGRGAVILTDGYIKFFDIETEVSGQFRERGNGKREKNAELGKRDEGRGDSQ